MPKERNRVEKAAGKLISAIQKEWSEEAGLACAPESEEVMYRSHDLLKAAKGGKFDLSILNGGSITELLGTNWVARHPRVIPIIKQLHQLIKENHAA